MTPAQRIGQLFMVGVKSQYGPATVERLIRQDHVGNVIYLGDWSGMTTVQQVSEGLQSQVSSAATGGVRLVIATDQEGGAVQELRGSGFTTLLPAIDQGRMTSAQLTAYARNFGGQLKQAGVNVDLAPVADTVPASIGLANGPIGRFGREYANQPQAVGSAVQSVVRGLTAAGVGSTLKHFPGLGRISGNTDVTSVGITDTQMTANDPYLQAFSDGIKAGASMVMMSSADYPKLDPNNPAVFSPAIVDGLLRGRLGWHGVVVTDDMGAVAVADVPAGQRATRFIGAGGDLVLIGKASDAPTMIAAVTQKVSQDPAFAGAVAASERRVLTLKASLGLLSCS